MDVRRPSGGPTPAASATRMAATWIALRSLARRILELIRGDVFFWQSLQAAAILVAVPIPFVFNLFWTASSAASPWGRSRVDRLAGPPHPGRDEGGDQAQAGRPDPGHRVLAGRIADHPGPDRDDGRADLVDGEHPAEDDRAGLAERLPAEGGRRGHGGTQSSP